MHKYNNQDHSMLTAMLSVENILGADHDVWQVNVEAEYHEEGEVRPTRPGREGGGRERSRAASRRDRRSRRTARRDEFPPVASGR